MCPADLHDSDAPRDVMFHLRLMTATSQRVDRLGVRREARRLGETAPRALNLRIKPVSPPKNASGFVVLPRSLGRRTQSCVNDARRRHARDHRRPPASSPTCGGPGRGWSWRWLMPTCSPGSSTFPAGSPGGGSPCSGLQSPVGQAPAPGPLGGCGDPAGAHLAGALGPVARRRVRENLLQGLHRRRSCPV